MKTKLVKNVITDVLNVPVLPLIVTSVLLKESNQLQHAHVLKVNSKSMLNVSIVTGIVQPVLNNKEIVETVLKTELTLQLVNAQIKLMKSLVKLIAHLALSNVLTVIFLLKTVLLVQLEESLHQLVISHHQNMVPL